MSGFELERQSLSEKLSGSMKDLVAKKGEDLNRNLIAELQKSSNIARDLSILYADRPYVYARVMQQLGKVLGKTKLRKLHSEVTSLAKSQADSRKLAQKVVKKSLKATNSGSGSGGSTDKNDAESGEKEISLNIPVLGLSGTKLKVNAANKSIDISQVKIPFLKNITGKADFNNNEVSAVNLGANLDIKYVKGTPGAQIRIGKRNGGFGVESASFDSATIDIPGLSGDVRASVALDNGSSSPKIAGDVSGDGKIIQDVNVSAQGHIEFVNSSTNFDTTLTVNGGKGATDAPAKGKSTGAMTYNGQIALKTENGSFSGATGQLNLGNISYLADPSDEVSLELSYNNDKFNAELKNEVKFKKIDLNLQGQGEEKKTTRKKGAKGESQGKATSVQITLNSASYSEDSQFSAECTIDCDLAGIIQASGTVSMAQNQVQSGSVTIAASEVPLLGKKAFLTCTLNGGLNINKDGFEGQCDGVFKLNVGGKKDLLINLDSLTFDNTAQFDGKAHLGAPFTFSSITVETFNAEFNSSEGLSNADGKLKVDAQTIKTADEGIALTYEGGELKAKGTLKLMGGGAAGGGSAEGGAGATGGAEGGAGGDEMATCDFEATLTPSTFTGQGDFTLTKPYKPGNGKLQIDEGSKATLKMTQDTIEPITFAGSYKYGHGDGGEGGEGGKDSKGGEKAATGGLEALKFSGDFTKCSFDPNSGLLNGAATANLESNLEFKYGGASLTIPAARRKKETALNIAIANSQVETIGGTLSYMTTIPIPKCPDVLDVEGTADEFTLQVPTASFTGLVSNRLRKNFTPITNEKFKIDITDNETYLKFNVANNVITETKLQGNADITFFDDIFEGGSGVFGVKLHEATVDLDTFAITSEAVTLSPKKDVTFKFGKRADAEGAATTIKLSKDSNVTAPINNNVIDTLSIGAGFEGETYVLPTETPIKFTGNSSVDVKNIQEKPTVDGTLDISTSEECRIDSIEDYDEITLLKGSSFGVSLSDNALDTITGNFQLKYAINPGAVAHLPKGLSLILGGSNLVYSVSEKAFSGDVSITAGDDIVLSSNTGGEQDAASGASGELTLLAGTTGLQASFTKNKLTKLFGVAGFKANVAASAAGCSGSIDIKKGSAKFDIDLETFAINQMDVIGKVTLNVTMPGAELKSKSTTITTSFDASGMKKASFDGSLNLTVNAIDTAPQFQLKGKLNYSKDNGFSSKKGLTLTCPQDAVLAQTKDARYEFGISASAKEGGVNIAIENSEVTRLSGTTGLFLRSVGGAQATEEEGPSDALNVTGDIIFDYDVLNQTLVSASGTATIAEKKICTLSGGDYLKLKESTVSVSMADNAIQSVKGTLGLALADGEGEYLTFQSPEELDCLDLKEINGDVTADFVREKEVGKGSAEGGKRFFINKGSGIKASLKSSKIDKLDGTFGFLVKDGEDDLYSGQIEGNYVAEGAKLNGNGQIKLLKDLPLPNDANPVFYLCKDSGGSAEVKDGAITSLSGQINVKLMGPQTEDAKEAPYIMISSSGDLDVAKGELNNFSGTATLSGEYQLAEGLFLTSLNASVGINQNKVEDINGSASIRYKKGNFTIEGACDTFKWTKGANGAKDTVNFSGGLDITAFEEKLKGNAHIDYDSASNSVSVDGELEFKITEWLIGKVKVSFDQGTGWDNPTIEGSLKAENVELVPGRTLMSFGKSLGVNVPVFTGVEAGAGLQIGASIDMEPVAISGEAKIEKFALKDLAAGALPDFELSAKATTGIKLSASVAPYVQLAIGFSPVLSGGIRVKGVAQATASAQASLAPKISGGKDGLSGELGMGVDVTAGASLSVIPELYLNVFGEDRLNKQLTEWKYDLGSIFNFNWGKTFKFGAKNEVVDGAESTASLPGETKIEQTETKEGQIENEYASKASPSTSEKDKPQLPDSKSVGDDSIGEKVGESADDKDGMSKTIDQVSKIAKAAGAIGDAVKIISGVVSASMATGPIGGVVYIAIKILTGEITLAKVKQAISDIKQGVAALQELIADNADLIRSLLPDWLVKIIDFVKDVAEDGLLNKVFDFIEEKINGLGSPLNEILEPVLTFIGKTKDKIAQVAQLFTGGKSAADIAKGMFSIIGLAISSIGDLLGAARDILNRLGSVISTCIKSGTIYGYSKKKGIFSVHYLHFEIPGLCKLDGPDLGVSKLFGIPNKK